MWTGDANYLEPKLSKVRRLVELLLVSFFDFSSLPPGSRIATEERVIEKLNQTKNSSGYQKMIQHTKVIGVWDDNDYNKNNGGSVFTAKDQNRKLYLDFVDEPNDSQRRL